MRTVLPGSFGTLSLGPIPFVRELSLAGVLPLHIRRPPLQTGRMRLVSTDGQRRFRSSYNKLALKVLRILRLSTGLVLASLVHQEFMADKQTLRKKLLAQRMEIKEQAAKKAAISLADNLLQVISDGSSVAGYCPIRGEIDVGPALEKLQEKGSRIALPVIDEASKVLKFLECSPDAPLIAGRYGISCPQPHLPEVIPDVVIVPLVGFDKNGNRLGYGGGYYDATIRHLRSLNKNVRIIGAAYAMQQVENIEPEPHDEKIDMVVTEQEIIRFA